MKQFTAPALVLATVLVFVLGRSLLVTAQPPESFAPAPASPIALPPPGAGSGPVAPPLPSPAPVSPAPKDPAAASLPELVELLKGVRQQKAELQRKEEQITATIRKKIEEENKLHDEVLQLIGAPDGGVPKGNGVPDPKIRIEDANTVPK